MVLSNMGGDEPIYKNVIEEFIGRSLGGHAQVETLHDMRFFPKIIIDVENVTFKRGSAPAVTPQDDVPAEPIVNPGLTIGRIQLSMGFFDIMFSTQKISVFNVQDVVSKAGVLSRKALSFERIGIVNPVEQTPYFIFNGQYDDNPMSLRGDMVASGGGYKFNPERQFEFTLSDLIMTGALSEFGSKTLRISDLNVKNPQDVMTGQLDFELETASRTMNITGNLDIMSQDLLLKSISEFYTLIDGVAKGKTEIEAYGLNLIFDNPDVDALSATIRLDTDKISATPNKDERLSDFHWAMIRRSIGADESVLCCEVRR